MSKTIEYYNKNADRYYKETVNLTEFKKEILDTFTCLMPVSHGCILDLGCGSGCDSKYLLNTGFEVEAVDGSEELVKLAARNLMQEVIFSDFRDFIPHREYVGIWACNSLIHIPIDDTIMVINKLTKHLKQDGIVYLCYHYGSGYKEKDSKEIYCLNEESALDMINQFNDLNLISIDSSSDGKHEFLNIFLRRK